MPLAFALAVLIFLGSFVPFVGATITGLVAVLVAFADDGWLTALIALGIVLGVQFIEGNFLQPIIQSRTVDLHPALILLAVAAGGSLFGIIGAYLAVPVTAVVFAVISSIAELERLRGAPLARAPTDRSPRLSARRALRLDRDGHPARRSSATAIAASPSPRPVKPSPSVVVARTATRPDRRPAPRRVGRASRRARARVAAARRRGRSPR